MAITSPVGLTPVQDPDDGPVLDPGDVHLGVADYAGDLDWFTVSLAKGERIRVVAAAAGFDAALYLDDVRTGETVGFGMDSGGPMGADDVLRFMAPRAGEYRIVLSDIRSFGFGGYRLELIRA